MTNLNKFAAQQLTKKQMNSILGSSGCASWQMEFKCTFYLHGGGAVHGNVCASDAFGAVIIGGQQIENSLGMGVIKDQTCIS